MWREKETHWTHSRHDTVFYVDTHTERYAKHTLHVTGESETCLPSS